MKWYDYFVCLWIADGMSASLMMTLAAATTVDFLWYSAMIVLGYLSFIFYADWRKEMIDQQK
jgi:hypothetical protein